MSSPPGASSETNEATKADCAPREVLTLPPEQLGERFSCLRLPDPKAVRRLGESLRRYGQSAPLVVWRAPDSQLELLDGFKRLSAMRQLGLSTVEVQVLRLTAQAARVAVLNLNQVSQSVSELEEGFVIRALVREEGLEQVEVALLLGRDKSWVCRRLSLVERLDDELKEQLRLGLLEATCARELARLPRGNQSEVLQASRDAELTTRQVARLVPLFNEASRSQQMWLLAHPRQALSNAQSVQPKKGDIRLGEPANRLMGHIDRLTQCARATVSSLNQVPLSTLTDTELPLVRQRLLLVRTDIGQLNIAIDRALYTPEDSPDEADTRPQGAQ